MKFSQSFTALNATKKKPLNVVNTKRWQRKREKIKKRDNYQCQICGKLISGRADVDHIKRRADGGRVWDNDNLQTLCHSCHTKKTNAEKKGPVRHDSSGNPTDPDHPWNKEEDDDDSSDA